jgi:hypothetical protein
VTTTSFSVTVCDSAKLENAAKTARTDAPRRTGAQPRLGETNDFIKGKEPIKKLSPSSPTVHERHGCTLASAATVLAGIRAGGINLHRLPKRVFKNAQ